MHARYFQKQWHFGHRVNTQSYEVGSYWHVHIHPAKGSQGRWAWHSHRCPLVASLFLSLSDHMPLKGSDFLCDSQNWESRSLSLMERNLGRKRRESHQQTFIEKLVISQVIFSFIQVQKQTTRIVKRNKIIRQGVGGIIHNLHLVFWKITYIYCILQMWT